MTQYVLRRMLLIPPTFLGITVMVFLITRFVPGGPIEQMIVQQQMAQPEGGSSRDQGVVSNDMLSAEQMQQLQEYYGFDKPVLVSYFLWLGKVLTFDLGESFRFNEPVWQVIKERLPISTFYGVATMLITYLVCIPLGIFKAIKHNSFFDNASSVLVFIGYAIPGYVVGIVMLFVFAANLEWFPIEGFYSDEFEDLSFTEQVVDILYHAILPLTAYVIGSFAVMTFLMKNTLLDNLAADYVRTAVAKGIPFRRAVFSQALRNSLIPMATHFGNNISVILAGSFLIEKIFNIDGIGLLGFESIITRDYPIVMGVLVISAILQLVGNILSDICVALVDPRVQFQ